MVEERQLTLASKAVGVRGLEVLVHAAVSSVVWSTAVGA